MENFIYTNNHCLSRGLCKNIIEKYEYEPVKYYGVTGAGTNKKVKDTVDFCIPLIKTEQKKELFDSWKTIAELLTQEIQHNVQIYSKQIQEYIGDASHNIISQLCGDGIVINSLMIQRYRKLQGKYIYHTDNMIELSNKKTRMITFLFYLNDVSEGGETELFGDMRIKPEAGKLLLFPACWTFPHCGRMPISHDKYIITGWIYVNY